MDKNVEGSLKRLSSMLELMVTRYQSQARELQRMDARLQQALAEISRLRQLLEEKKR